MVKVIRYIASIVVLDFTCKSYDIFSACQLPVNHLQQSVFFGRRGTGENGEQTNCELAQTWDVTVGIPHAGAFASFVVGSLVLQPIKKNTRHKHYGMQLVRRQTGETPRRGASECAGRYDRGRSSPNLIRRRAGAEDEALREAVPAELGVGDIARQSCEEQSGEHPLRRHPTSSAPVETTTGTRWEWR